MLHWGAPSHPPHRLFSKCRFHTLQVSPETRTSARSLEFGHLSSVELGFLFSPFVPASSVLWRWHLSFPEPVPFPPAGTSTASSSGHLNLVLDSASVFCSQEPSSPHQDRGEHPFLLFHGTFHRTAVPAFIGIQNCLYTQVCPSGLRQSQDRQGALPVARDYSW